MTSEKLTNYEINSACIDILTVARKLIESPSHWTQGALCRNRQGQQVSTNSDEAYCYCAQGAVIAVCDHKYVDHYTQLTGDHRLWNFLNRVSNKIYPEHGFLSVLNDFGSHKDVLEVYDRAIDILKKNIDSNINDI